MKNVLVISLLLLSGLACSDTQKVQIVDGWIKQLPPVIPMRAGYLQINNLSTQTQEIIAVQSDAFESVELHETIISDGMMKMIEMESINLPAKSTVEFKPGGKHLMLIAPKQSLQIGDEVELIITFSDDTTQRIELEVRK